MKVRGPIFLSVLMTGLLLAAFYPPYDTAEKEAVLMQSILTGLNYYHFSPQDINDEFSNKVYDIYLDRLDGGKRWLLQSDIKQLESFKAKLDDQATAGTYDFLTLSIQLQETGLKRTQEYYKEFLSKPFDFTKDEKIELDGEKRKFSRTEAELKEHWRKLMKYETMTRLADKLEKKAKGDEDFKDKSDEELEAKARKEVLKVYDDWYDRLERRKRSDHLSNYLNAFTNIFDPHTGYYEPIDKENFNIGMSGKLKGIGARLTTEGDYTKVTEIIIGGPAWKQGILEKDDKITKVAQGNDEPVDVTGMVINDVVKLIRGEPDTEVRLWIKKADGTSQVITIVRDVVVIEESFAKSLILNSEEDTKIGYIKLPRFYGDYQNANGRQCSDDIAKEIKKVQAENVDGIILDLRSNGGGYLSEVVKMSGLFIEEGPIVQVKSRGRKAQVLDDDDPRVQYRGPLVVMVNSFSASASEILAAALQDYGRAVIVGTGTSTFGKGTVQRFFDLDRTIQGHSEVKPLGEIKLTVQKYYRVNGGSVQLKGVKPDIIIPDIYYELETGEKEHEYPMAWTEIDPAEYSQHVYNLDNLAKVREKAAYRIRINEDLQKVMEVAKRRKENREDSDYALNMETYQSEQEALEAESKEFKEMFEKEVITDISNTKADIGALATADDAQKERNKEWLETVKKDIYLDETLNIVHDLIHLK